MVSDRAMEKGRERERDFFFLPSRSEIATRFEAVRFRFTTLSRWNRGVVDAVRRHQPRPNTLNYISSGRVHAMGDPRKPHAQPTVHNYPSRVAMPSSVEACHGSLV